MIESLEEAHREESEIEDIRARETDINEHVLNEAELKAAIEQAEAQIGSDEKRVLDGAANEIASSRSMVVDRSKAEAIMEQGGFAARIQGIKDKISALTEEAKTRIATLMGGSRASNNEPKQATEPIEPAAPEVPKEKNERKDAALPMPPMTLDQYMAGRGQPKNLSERMRDSMQIAELKLHRIKDPERVLGLARYLEERAVNVDASLVIIDKKKTSEIEKAVEKYKKLGYEVDVRKPSYDENIRISASKETPFRFSGTIFERSALADMAEMPNDPVATLELLGGLGFHVEVPQDLMDFRIKDILKNPNTLSVLEKMRTFGGSSVSHELFGKNSPRDALSNLSHLIEDDAETHFFTGDSEKKIEQVSGMLGHPIDITQLRDWMKVSKSDAMPEVLAALIKNEKSTREHEEGLVSFILEVQDAGIEDAALSLLKDGFSRSEFRGLRDDESSKKEETIKNLRTAADAFAANPRLSETVRAADEVFERDYKDGGALDPKNLEYFSGILKDVPDAGAALSTLAAIGVRAEYGGRFRHDANEILAHKDILEAVAQPDFKGFAELCEQAGYTFTAEDFFPRRGGSRSTLIEAFHDEKFRAGIGSEDGVALAEYLGTFKSSSSNWNVFAFDRLAGVPDALATLKKLESGYGFRYSPKGDHNNYQLQDVMRVLQNNTLRETLLDPGTIEFVGSIKNDFGISFNVRDAESFIEISGSPEFREMMKEPEAVAFAKKCMTESNAGIELLGALLECDPTLRPGIEKMVVEFGYTPRAAYESRHTYNLETNNYDDNKELVLNDRTMLAKLRDNPKLFEVQERLALAGMQKNPLHDIAGLEKIDDGMVAVFEQAKGSPKIQDFLWRNLDAAGALARMSPEKLPTYMEIFQKIDDSPSQEIQRLKQQLLSQLLESDRPAEDYQQIESIFIKNNIPTVGKVFNVFETLYDKKRLDAMVGKNNKASPVLESASSRRRYYTVYQDLLNIHIESGNRSLKEYVEVLKSGGDVLDRYEQDGAEALSPREQEQLRYFVGKLETLLAKSALDASDDAFRIADSGNLSERIGHVREGLAVAEGQTVLGRVSEMYLRPAGAENLDEILAKMRDAKTGADARGRAIVGGATKRSASGKAVLEIKEGDLLKGVNDEYIANILQNGSVAKEFLGASSDSDSTPLDTDLSIVLGGDLENGNESAIGNSIAKDYGDLLFVLRDHGNFQRTELGTDAKPEAGKRELFKTGVVGERHYGIRTGFATTEIDFMVANGSALSKDVQRQERLFFEIAQNGFYIPIVNESGEVIFTPDMYDERRRAFEGLEKFDGEALPFKPTTPDEISSKAISEIVKDLPDSSEEVERATQTIRNEIQQALSGLGVTLRPEFDTSILGAELLDTGSTGRHTNAPGDFDFDFSLKLDAKDFEKARDLAVAIKGLMKMEKDDSHDEPGGYYQLRAKGVTEIGGRKFEKPLDIDIGFAKKSDLSVYGSHDAIHDKLGYIKDHDGDEAYRQAVANIVLTKQVLKKGHAYKKLEDGGIGGIGVENWILANGGNMEAAFQSFRNVAYENGLRIPFEEFKKWYTILDAGVNVKYLNHDNFVNILKPEGYEAMLNTMDAYAASRT